MGIWILNGFFVGGVMGGRVWFTVVEKDLIFLAVGVLNLEILELEQSLLSICSSCDSLVLATVKSSHLESGRKYYGDFISYFFLYPSIYKLIPLLSSYTQSFDL